MRKSSIKDIIVQCVAWVLLIQIVNISIDPIDHVSDKLGRLAFEEDLSVNDIESIYELFSEQYLGIDIPEQDEDDGNGFIKIIDFYFSQSSFDIKEQYQPIRISFLTIEKNLTSIVLDHTSPPPKVA
jgi:hypothetical protein